MNGCFPIKNTPFIKNQVDTNIYVQWASAIFLFIGLYVDDTILVNSLTLLASIKETLSKECEMTDNGEIALKDF
jgi:hypothetical protein